MLLTISTRKYQQSNTHLRSYFNNSGSKIEEHMDGQMRAKSRDIL